MDIENTVNIDTVKLIAQIIGIIATVVTILSFQQKTQKNIAIWQAVGSMAWFIHYLMIGAYTGGLLNIVSLTKNILLSKRDKWKWLGSVWFTVGVSVLSFAVYIVSFTVFNPSPTIDVMLVELLPVGAMIVSTLALQNRDAKKVRLLSLICSPMWLTYNAVNGSIGGIITECFSIVSIIIAFLRLDRKKK